jgi:hypothetical protein
MSIKLVEAASELFRFLTSTNPVFLTMYNNLLPLWEYSIPTGFSNRSEKTGSTLLTCALTVKLKVNNMRKLIIKTILFILDLIKVFEES